MQGLHLYRHLRTGCGHVEVDDVEAHRLRALLVANLVVAVLRIERGLIIVVLCCEVLASTVEVEGHTALGILEELLLVVLVVNTEDAHIGFRGILRILRFIPDAT